MPHKDPLLWDLGEGRAGGDPDLRGGGAEAAPSGSAGAAPGRCAGTALDRGIGSVPEQRLVGGRDVICQDHGAGRTVGIF